jgi:hypothetical protein
MVVEAILAAQRSDPAVAPRSRAWLMRAARRGCIIAAYDAATHDAAPHDAAPHDTASLVGWVLSEPCTPHTTELGGLYVLPGSRDGEVVRELTRAGLALRPRSLVVTMDPRFAQWLLADWDFTEITLPGMVRASRGMFLVRRLSPWRMRAALGHVRTGQPRYLIREANDLLNRKADTL